MEKRRHLIIWALRFVRKVNTQQAIECIQKSIQLKRRISDRQGIALALNNLAVTYRDMKAYDFAISAWEEAIELISDINPTDMEQFTERKQKVQEMETPCNRES